MKQKDQELQKLKSIAAIIRQSKTFFIAGHVKPDGDSIGSCLALRSILNRMGKKAKVYCADEVPRFLHFLKGVSSIKKSAAKTESFDCAIIIECINFERMGDIISSSQAKKIINIDHHSAFTDFGDVNYIVPNSSSTAELVLRLLDFMKIKPLKSEAECLYTGIVTDTGRFQQLNTTADSHIAAAKLIKAGVSPNGVCRKIYDSHSLAGVKLLGCALENVKTDFNGTFAYTLITKDMFLKSGANENETEGIVNAILSIEGVKVACLFKETGAALTKASFRSVKDINILSVVSQCGGGGHKNAAGCTLQLDSVSAVTFIKKILKEKMYA
ncbi:MAG: bifunctional oligoribonuclease/PAP phosphatase NrnA [Endomicrobium sp.]|jgi:phosphoesterase RecJ-like protein|nr:bifunctional oligoribonuclease/PAP phosphatase NrnA [Endomicrobium sp.]